MTRKILTTATLAILTILAVGALWSGLQFNQAQATQTQAVKSAHNNTYMTPVVIDGEAANIPSSLKDDLVSFETASAT